MIENKSQFLNFLKRHHTGKRNAIYSMRLAEAFSCKETDIRRVIHELRAEDHEPILSSVECGYWFAANRAEALEYINTQKSRLHEQSEAMVGVIEGLDRYFDPVKLNLFEQVL